MIKTNEGNEELVEPKKRNRRKDKRGLLRAFVMHTHAQTIRGISQTGTKLFHLNALHENICPYTVIPIRELRFFIIMKHNFLKLNLPHKTRNINFLLHKTHVL